MTTPPPPASGTATTAGPPAGLEIVTGNPRPGLRRWVLNTLVLRGGREIYAELHHERTVLLAADLSWHALGRTQVINPSVADSWCTRTMSAPAAATSALPPYSWRDD